MSEISILKYFFHSRRTLLEELSEIQKLIKKIWTEEIIPTIWIKANIVPILKKGDPTVCESCRDVVLLDTMYKIFATLLKSRFKQNED